MAAKNAMVRSVRATSSAEPPPGRATSAKAMTATSPNFAAVFTGRRVAALGPPLADRASGHQDEHDAAEGDPVGDENGRRVGDEVAQQEGDRGVAGHESQQRGDREAADRTAVAAHVPQLEQPAQHDGRNREQEREAGRAGPVEALEQPGGDRRPRARYARHERQRLGEPHDDPVARPDLLERPVVAAHPLRQEQDQPEDDQGAADQVEVARSRLDLVLEDEAEDRDRDRAYDQVPTEASIQLTPAPRVAEAGQPGSRDPE